ncbi:MAG TPA: hypothetical protein VFT31_11035 [Kribbella sp.]|nr:hypothetical protein [Kribbella sp.]
MAQIAMTELTAAAAALVQAGCWEIADRVLFEARPDDPAETLVRALAEADLAVERDFAQGTDHSEAKLAAVSQALEQAPSTDVAWDLALLQLRGEYFAALLTADGSLQLGPDGRDPTASAALARRAEELRRSAPDDRRAGSVAFYEGLIADNLHGRQAEASAHYTAALELAERAGDDLLVALALRHLGDHAHTAGNLVLARAQWERSTELRQKAGHVPGVLAQQALLAVLARDEGDRTAAVALATEVHRWARSLQIGWLEGQTTDLLNDEAPLA